MKRLVASLVAISALVVPNAVPAGLTSAARASSPEPAATRVELRVDASGFHPSRISVHVGEPIVLVVTRTSDESCGNQIVFPALGIRRDLPLNQPVEIRWMPRETGDMAFTCGMGMYRGAVIAQ